MSESIVRCEFCGRGKYLSNPDNCRGCGATFPVAVTRDYSLGEMITAQAQSQSLASSYAQMAAGRPFNAQSATAAMLNAIAPLAAAMCGRRR